MRCIIQLLCHHVDVKRSVVVGSLAFAFIGSASPAEALVLVGDATGTISNMVDGNGLFGFGSLFGKQIEVRFQVNTATPDILLENTKTTALAYGGGDKSGRPVTAQVMIDGFVHDVSNSFQGYYSQQRSFSNQFYSSVILMVTNDDLSDNFDYVELGANDYFGSSQTPHLLPTTAKFGTPIDFTQAVGTFLNISFHRGFHQTIEARDIHLVVNSVSNVPEPWSGMSLIAGLGMLGCISARPSRKRPLIGNAPMPIANGNK